MCTEVTNAHLGPTTPYASVEHEHFKYVGYTGVFNVLDYPAVSFPSGVTAHKELDKAGTVEPLSDLCTAVQGLCEFVPSESSILFLY
jgi:amidase